MFILPLGRQSLDPQAKTLHSQAMGPGHEERRRRQTGSYLGRNRQGICIQVRPGGRGAYDFPHRRNREEIEKMHLQAMIKNISDELSFYKKGFAAATFVAATLAAVCCRHAHV